MAREAPLDLREAASKTRDATGLHRLSPYPYRPHLQGGSVTMDVGGTRIYALLPMHGALVALDAKTFDLVASTPVCARPEQVVVAANDRAYVTCRGDGRVVVVDAEGNHVAERALGGEPFGIALSPNGERLVVTTATAAIGLDARDLKLRWTRALGGDPRGVAIAAGGERATIAHLRGGHVSVLDVASGGVASTALPNLRDGWPSELWSVADDKPDARAAGGAFAVAASPGGTRTFVPYLLKNDGSKIEDFLPGCYANGADLPIAASVAAIDVARGRALRPALRTLAPDEQVSGGFGFVGEMGQLGVVRAAFHDPKHSRLFAIGEGSGMMAAFDTSKADPTTNPLGFWTLPSAAKGLVVDPAGERVFVHLALSNDLHVIALDDGGARTVTLAATPAPSRIDRGQELFHAANNFELSGFSGVACSSCHLDGRSDGITWRLDGKPLQTPSLAGRSFSGHALRWHGDSPTLEHAVQEAISRLGGSGLPESDAGALADYLMSRGREMSPTIATSTSSDGAALFTSAGCAGCHTPETDYSDGQLHSVRGAMVRTPSLRGVGASAPYYHDGSSATLRTLLQAHDDDNPMAVGKLLNAAERAELERYLRSL